MAIGDDLQILLGMVPIRDRAGIARGTMADAAQAAASPHANGQDLTRQGFDFARPPAFALPPGMGQPGGDVQLPDNVNAEYTAGSGGRAMSPAKPPLKQPLPPPEPTERVVASSPAAAPSPEVVRGSDVLMKAYEQQQRAARMQAIFQSIGGIVGHARGENVSGGGGAAAGGPDLNSLKTIIDMRNAENQQAAALAVRKQTIEELQRTNGYSPEMAAAKYDSGEYKDDLKQDTIAKREAAKLAGTTREELLKPEIVTAIAKRLGIPEAVAIADIRSGKIGAKELADIESTQATTAKTGVEARGKAADLVGIEEAQKTPAAVAERYRQMGFTDVTEDVVKSASSSGPTWAKFGENHQPLSTADLRDLEVENRMRATKGQPPLTPSEFKLAGQPKHIESAEAAAEGKLISKRNDEVIATRDRALEAKRFIEGGNEMIGAQLAKSPKLLLGPWSEHVLDVRRFWGDVLKMPSETVKSTDAFKAALKEYGLEINKAFKGNFSDKDQRTVDAITGVKDYTPDTLKDLIELREKHKMLEWYNANKELQAAHQDPQMGAMHKKYIPEVSIPAMSTLLQKSFNQKTGGEAAAMEFLAKNRDNPKVLALFDRDWGAGRAEDFLKRLPKE